MTIDFGDGTGQQILQCNTCQLGHTRYIPTLDTIASLYEDHGSRQLEGVRDFDPASSAVIDKSKDLLARVQLRQAARNSVPKRFIDFGTGNARFAIQAQRLWPTCLVIAVDYQEQPPESLILHPEIQFMQVDKFLSTQSRYDLIFLRHVLEHSLDPILLLKSLGSRLEDGGSIYVEVPNTNSRIQKIVKHRSVNWYVPQHILHFNRKSLQSVGERSGFESIISKQNIPVMGDQLVQLRNASNSNMFYKILGGLFHPIQLILEIGKDRGSSIAAILRKI
jgi:SAM-dependent methyltransferase